MMNSCVCVLVPAYGHAAFLPRALESLLAQTFKDFVAVVVDDGSPDTTQETVAPFLADPRLSYRRLPENQGLGAALNFALEQTSGELVAYLPADDLYYPEHLATLAAALDAHPQAVLAVAGVRHHYNRTSPGAIDGYPLQLVQVMHRRRSPRWIERSELVTDDLERMYWSRLRPCGEFIDTRVVTCEWTDHPNQQHKTIREPLGGVNRYRSVYGVREPLRFHSTAGSLVDEPALYAHYRSRPDTPRAPGGLKIVLCGELAYNADRVLALEERGHKLYGLWMDRPHGYNTVGPLPFGHVEDIPRTDWRRELRRIRPDLIYGLLNWQAVEWAHHVMAGAPDVPFVWHFKEGPFICLNRGTWPQLMDLYLRSDGRIFVTPEMRDWFRMIAPDTVDDPGSLVLDGDLPKRDWFSSDTAPRLSESTGEIHTVVPGRPIGLHTELVVELARAGVHLHFYGEATHSLWREWIDRTGSQARGYLHLHPNVDQRRWVQEFSQYDAGWLHYFESANQGEIARADWDDLNIPARIGPLVAAGLPLLQRDNTGSIVATDALARSLDIGVSFRSMSELAERLRDKSRMEKVRANVWRARDRFTFDHHADRLIEFFRQTIARRQ